MSELDWLDDEEERVLESVTMTNQKKKLINNIYAMDEDEFTKCFCRISSCTSCPGKPLDNECHKRLKEWLKHDAKND